MISNDYKIVIDIVFPNGDEEYVIWEPFFYAELLERKVNLYELFYNSPDAIKTPPLDVNIFLYHNPIVQTISSTIGSKIDIKQLLVGKKICYITSI
jgi:hypothetical protein